MKYHEIKSDIWEDEKFIELKTEEKLLFIYLSTNQRCPPSGMYKLSIRTVEFETGIIDCSFALDRLVDLGLIEFDKKKNSFWICGKIKHHKTNFNSDYVTVKSISNDLENFKATSWYSSIFDKYPQLIDIGIQLEQMKKIRYNPKEKQTCL